LDGRPPEAFLTLLHERDYFGLLAYLGPDPELAAQLHALRVAVRDSTRAATMFGYGPRYLHSTGQLHKGGANTGVFILDRATRAEACPIPTRTRSRRAATTTERPPPLCSSWPRRRRARTCRSRGSRSRSARWSARRRS